MLSAGEGYSTAFFEVFGLALSQQVDAESTITTRRHGTVTRVLNLLLFGFTWDVTTARADYESLRRRGWTCDVQESIRFSSADHNLQLPNHLL